MDSRRKSLYKTITWRVSAMIATLIVSYLMFGNLTNSVEFTTVITIITAIMYFVHERLWKNYE